MKFGSGEVWLCKHLQEELQPSIKHSSCLPRERQAFTKRVATQYNTMKYLSFVLGSELNISLQCRFSFLFAGWLKGAFVES